MSTPQAFHWTVFRGFRGTSPVSAFSGSWTQVVDALSHYAECPDKDTRDSTALLFGPYNLTGSRADHNARDLCLAVFDYDAGTPDDVATTRARLSDEGIAQHWYTSFNHGVNGKVAWRLVLPLSEPVGRAAWKALRADLVRRYSLKVEAAKCEGFSHMYFLPVRRPGQATETYSREGGFVDTSVIAAAFPPNAFSPFEARGIDAGDVAENLEELRDQMRTRAEYHRSVGFEDKALILERLAAGVPVTDSRVVVSQSGDPPLARAAALLVTAVPEESIATYEALLLPSWEAAETRIPRAKVCRMIRTAVAKRDTYKPLVAQMRAAAEEWM